MKTATKNNFTDREIKAVIQVHFPDDAVTEIIPLIGGTFNTIYQVNGTGALKSGVILKTGPGEGVEVTEHEKDILKTEVYAYKMMEGKKIPVPKVYAYDFSRTILPCDYFLMERMEGDTWFEHWPIRDAGLMCALGKYTARMHSVETDWFGAITDGDVGRYDTWGSAFTAMVEQTLNECEKQGLRMPYSKVRKAVYSRRDMLNELKKPSFVNFDLWAGNVFVRKEEDGYYLTGMIDFERSFLGDPLASFASALLLYDNVEKETAFLEGYNKVSEKPLVISGADREKMALYEMLMYIRAYSETRRYNGPFRFFQRIGIRMIVQYILWDLRRKERHRHS